MKKIIFLCSMMIWAPISAMEKKIVTSVCNHIQCDITYLSPYTFRFDDHGCPRINDKLLYFVGPTDEDSFIASGFEKNVVLTTIHDDILLSFENEKQPRYVINPHLKMMVASSTEEYCWIVTKKNNNHKED